MYSLRRSRRVHHASPLIALALVLSISLQPTLATPLSELSLLPKYTVDFASRGVTLHLVQVTGGYDYFDPTGAVPSGHVTQSIIDLTEIVVTNSDPQSVVATISVPNSQGQLLAFAVEGVWDATTETFSGSMNDSGGALHSTINIDALGATDGPSDVVVVISIALSAAAIAALGCAANWIIRGNCALNCSDACDGEGQVMCYSKGGFCGQCCCVCSDLSGECPQQNFCDE